MRNGFARDSLAPMACAATFYPNPQIRSIRSSRTATESRKSGERGKVLTSRMVRHDASGLLAGAALALTLGASALVLASSSALADPPPAADPAATSPAPPDADLGPPSLTPFEGSVELEDRLAPASRLRIAGEQLHDHLLRRFYLAHGYQPVWDRRPSEAAALWKAVLRAGDQGLDPASFHSAVLSEHGAALTPIERDLLLSDGLLSYVDALARGAMPVEERYDDEDLQPEPVDAVAALDAAIAAPDPAKAIETLAPASPEYSAMRQAYADYLATGEGGRGRSAGARDRPEPPRRPIAADTQRRVRQLAVNLERLRWLPRKIPGDRVVVDTAISQLRLFRDDRPVFTTRVVVGELDKQTPELQSVIRDILFNPPWNIPRSIVEKEILPKLASDRHYLAEHHMRFRGPMAVQQEAGPYSALGRLKFEMDDRFDVYLHDTPQKALFHAADRMMSHGCVRVENPRALAALLLDESPEAVDKAVNVDRTHRRALPKPIPVFIVYHTVEVESDGSIAFRADPYQRDNEIWEYLNRAQQPPLAQDTAASHRKG
jgi:murein L,D-transpeptidase YcbB/YkuD